ncbi:MAG: hypothetical protein GY942_23340, partial [Aestuariibacter sp.]|nr:hypothetical protein [Aestuariibacter sp.]
ALFTFCYSYNVLAAPGTLAQAPLFLRAGVSPNVFLTLDNSRSMYFEALLDDGTVTDTRHGVYKPVNSGRTLPYLYKGFNPANRTMAPDFGQTLTGVPDLGIFRNHIANGVYYNPNITYTPWVGQDADGNNFEDATANKAWQYPNVTTGTFADLTVEHQWANNDSGSKYRLSTYYNWD